MISFKACLFIINQFSIVSDKLRDLTESVALFVK